MPPNTPTGRPGAPKPGYEIFADQNIGIDPRMTVPDEAAGPVASTTHHAANMARVASQAQAAAAERAKRKRQPGHLPQSPEEAAAYEAASSEGWPAEIPPLPAGFPPQPQQAQGHHGHAHPGASGPPAMQSPRQAAAPVSQVMQSPRQPPPLSFPPSPPNWGPNSIHAAMPMTSGAPNPLMAYTRMPGMNVKLPSNGAYMPAGTLVLGPTGELSIYPMRAADEVMLKNPDALMSGQAVEQMIRSCAPGIQEPMSVSMPDLDVLLLAIRAASYGDQMEFDVTCPHCKAENTFDANLIALLANVTDLPASCPVELVEGVTAFLRPYSVRNATQVAVVTFEETRRMQGVEEAPDNVRSETMTIALKRINELSELMLADCVMQVVTPEGTVADPHHIREFLGNIPRGWTRKMEAALKDLNAHGLSKTIEPTCKKCGHTWKTELEFDPSSFFGQGS